MTHHRNECEHGTIMGQCRCSGIYGVKEKRIVPCNSRCPEYPPCEPAAVTEVQGDGDKVITGDCDGSASCPAAYHFHGCYADDGNCNMVLEHLHPAGRYTSEEFANMASERYDAGFEAGRKFGLQQAVSIISKDAPWILEGSSDGVG